MSCATRGQRVRSHRRWEAVVLLELNPAEMLAVGMRNTLNEGDPGPEDTSAGAGCALDDNESKVPPLLKEGQAWGIIFRF